MNAVISLCHFCEAHGPTSILCTQALKETKIEDIDFNEIHSSNQLCPACNSVGSGGLLSNDEKNEISYLSTPTPIFPEVCSLIKQASVRSLSCEISSKKDGGIVFFGDSLNGYVLSHTFHVSDLQARGFFQLFSIIVLMKDKYFLLNIKPFLGKHMNKISSEIQLLAKRIRNEEKARSSPIERSLSGGSQIIPSTPRSLINLTGEDDIFQYIHSSFTWMLMAGTKVLTERISLIDLPDPICVTPTKNKTICSIFRCKEQKSIVEDDKPCTECDNINNEPSSLRSLKCFLDKNFIQGCYCALVGIKIIIRGPRDKTNLFVNSFKNLLPLNLHKLIIQNAEFTDNDHFKIMAVRSEIAVPIPCSSVFRIDCVNDQICVKWLGEIPSKLPNLLLQIIKAVDEKLFNEDVLEKRLTVLIEEWKNKVIFMSKIHSSSDLAKFKKTFGILPQDQLLINYWKQYL